MSQAPHNGRQSRTHLEASVKVVPGTQAPTTPETKPAPEPQAPPPPAQPKGRGSLLLLKQMYRDWRTAGGTPDIFAPCQPPGVPMVPGA